MISVTWGSQNQLDELAISWGAPDVPLAQSSANALSTASLNPIRWTQCAALPRVKPHEGLVFVSLCVNSTRERWVSGVPLSQHELLMLQATESVMIQHSPRDLLTRCRLGKYRQIGPRRARPFLKLIAVCAAYLDFPHP